MSKIILEGDDFKDYLNLKNTVNELVKKLQRNKNAYHKLYERVVSREYEEIGSIIDYKNNSYQYITNKKSKVLEELRNKLDRLALDNEDLKLEVKKAKRATLDLKIEFNNMSFLTKLFKRYE